MNLILNASNLHVGGGIQVACSIIEEIYENIAGREFEYNILILVSNEIIKSLPTKQHECKNVKIKEYNSYGPVGGLESRRYIINTMDCFKADAIFSIFGPTYLYSLPIPHIIGFANAWLVTPDCMAYELMRFKDKVRARFKYFLYKASLYYESKFLITETNLMKAKINRDPILKNKKVKVIGNCHSSLYLDPCKWEYIDIPDVDSDFILCTISNGYIHKNLDIISDVGEFLLKEYNLKVTFITTLPHDVYNIKSEKFKKYTVNLGVVSPYQCPYIYNIADALFLPTLLETFSASYPEAMVMGKPIITSNLDFALDICGDSAFYFEPLVVKSISEQIYICFSDNSVRLNKIESARKILSSMPNSKQRLHEILFSIKEIINETSITRHG